MDLLVFVGASDGGGGVFPLEKPVNSHASRSPHLLHSQTRPSFIGSSGTTKKEKKKLIFQLHISRF